jgi:LAO/AO transport system kinase
VDVVSLADSTLVLLAPGMGDGIQAAKAGILEIADVFVVNKADREGAEQTARELGHMMSLGRRELTGARWRQPILTTIAADGTGVDEVAEAIEAHHTWLVDHDELAARRVRRAGSEIEAIAMESLRARLGDVHDGAAAALASRVAAGDIDPYAAAEELIAAL